MIVADIPEPALFRLPTILRVHKPDQRIHVTRDAGAVRRQEIALTRDHTSKESSTPMRLTADAAKKYADAFGVSIGEFLKRLARCLAGDTEVDFARSDLDYFPAAARDARSA